MVGDAPFIMLAGEVHNSNSSGLACMEAVWARALGMNSVLLPGCFNRGALSRHVLFSLRL